MKNFLISILIVVMYYMGCYALYCYFLIFFYQKTNFAITMVSKLGHTQVVFLFTVISIIVLYFYFQGCKYIVDYLQKI